MQNIEIFKEKESNEDTDYGKDPGPGVGLNQNFKRDKEELDLRRKYFGAFVGKMKHYSKKLDNNIKRADSKDSETSGDISPETIKRRKRNNIPTSSSNIIQKKKIIANSNGINRDLRNEYEIEQINRNFSFEFESKVANVSINKCYDNPYRDQYLKIINEKKKQNPGKIVEFIIPQFTTPFLQSYMPPNQYNPYLNQNMYMYPPQYQMPMGFNNPQLNSIVNQKVNSNSKGNSQMNSQMAYPPHPSPPLNQQFIPQINQQINSQMNSPFNNQMNLQMNPQINNNNYFGMAESK